MLTVTVPAESVDLTTIVAVKAEISTDNDALLATMITQASQAIADYCGRVFVRETVQEILRPCRRQDLINLERWPVASVTSIAEDGISLAAESYETDPVDGQLLRLRDGMQGSWSVGKIVIVYAAGYAADSIPDPLQRAAVELVKCWWAGKDRDPAVRDIQYSDQSKISYQVNSGSLPPIVTDLVAPYRSAWAA